MVAIIFLPTVYIKCIVIVLELMLKIVLKTNIIIMKGFPPIIPRVGPFTVGENIIATTKIRNNYAAIKSFISQYCDRNIGLFYIISCKVITLNPLCILFGISTLLLF
jgi:hypothetical protein